MMSNTQTAQLSSTPIDQQKIEQFLIHEARLLDDQEFLSWNDLFTDDGIYWIPATRGQTDPLNEISHMYENSLLREIRAMRLAGPNAPSLQPMPRTSHLISNITITEYDEAAGNVTTHSRFLMTQYHRDAITHFAGECIHELIVADDGEIKIKMKRVNLVNCEGMIGDIVLCI